MTAPEPIEHPPPGGHVETQPSEDTTRAPARVEDVRETLCEVIDPDIGVNIIDLGLVYGVEVEQGGRIVVTMTLASQGCPSAPLLEHFVHKALAVRHHTTDTVVNWVWKPAWDPGRITPDGFDQLRALGFRF
jgi:metal-sulfur cluster biosynthetic enzyme